MSEKKEKKYDEKNLNELLEQLKNIYSKKRIILFLGAGIDKHIANIPSWSDFKKEYKNNDNFEVFQNILVIQEFEKEYINTLNEINTNNKNRFNKFVESLKSIYDKDQNDCTVDFLTTNNSSVIEKEIKISQNRVFTPYDKFTQVDKHQSILYYVHGNINNNTHIASFSQYYKYFSNNKFKELENLFEKRFYDKEENKIVIIIGYSLSEPHLLSLLWQLIEKGRQTAIFYITTSSITDELYSILISKKFYWINLTKIFTKDVEKNESNLYDEFYKHLEEKINSFIKDIKLDKSYIYNENSPFKKIKTVETKKELEDEVKAIKEKNINEEYIFHSLTNIALEKQYYEKTKLIILKYLYEEKKLNYNLINKNVSKSTFDFLDFYIRNNKNNYELKEDLFWIRDILKHNSYKANINKIKNIIDFIKNKINYAFSYDYLINMIIPNNGIKNKIKTSKLKFLFKKLKINKNTNWMEINLYFDIINSFFQNVNNLDLIECFENLKIIVISIKEMKSNHNLKKLEVENFYLIKLIKKYNLINKDEISNKFEKIKNIINKYNTNSENKKNKFNIIENEKIIFNLIFNIYILYFDTNDIDINNIYKTFKFYLIKNPNSFYALDSNSKNKYDLWEEFKNFFKENTIQETINEIKNKYEFYYDNDPFFIDEIIQKNIWFIIKSNLSKDTKIVESEFINKLNDIHNNKYYWKDTLISLSTFFENRILDLNSIIWADNLLCQIENVKNIKNDFYLVLKNEIKNNLQRDDSLFNIQLKSIKMKKIIENLFFKNNHILYYSCIENFLLYHWVSKKEITWNFIDKELREKIKKIINDYTFKMFYLIFFEYEKYSLDNDIKKEKFTKIEWLKINDFIEILQWQKYPKINHNEFFVKFNCYEKSLKFIYMQIFSNNNLNENEIKEDIEYFLEIMFNLKYELELTNNEHIYYRFDAFFKVKEKYETIIDYYLSKQYISLGVIKNIFYLVFPDKENILNFEPFIHKIKDLFLTIYKNKLSEENIKNLFEKIELKENIKRNVNDIFIDKKTIEYNSFLIALKYWIYNENIDHFNKVIKEEHQLDHKIEYELIQCFSKYLKSLEKFEKQKDK